MKKIISDEVSYSLENISEEERVEDLEFMMERGNHKSAQTPLDNVETLKDKYVKEVRNGWMVPLPSSYLKKLKGASVIPVGVHTQYTIDDNGKRKVNRRTTHDASFPPPSTKSMNNRMRRDELTECFYGHCLLRVLHMIHRMTVKHPKLRILLIKIDLDSAY